MHAPRERHFAVFYQPRGVLRGGFVIQMQIAKFCADVRELPKIFKSCDQWQTRQFAFEILRVFIAVRRMMQQRINVMENIALAGGRKGVLRAELFQRPIGDVLRAVAAVFGVGC